MDTILQKIIAKSGPWSRRKAEALIRAGRVKINGQIAIIGQKADQQRDNITIDERHLAAAISPIYIKLNKPAGYTCTNRSFPGEKNIFNLVDTPERLFAVGRLDKDSRGLVLLTNDGDLAQRLSHPRFQHKKTYEVSVKEKIRNPDSIMAAFLRGIDIGEGDDLAHANDIQYLQNNTFVITLSEGKKRQIRRMFRALNLRVADLKRKTIASLDLGNLSEGKWAYLSQQEIKQLQNNK